MLKNTNWYSWSCKNNVLSLLNPLTSLSVLMIQVQIANLREGDQRISPPGMGRGVGGVVQQLFLWNSWNFNLSFLFFYSFAWYRLSTIWEIDGKAILSVDRWMAVISRSYQNWPLFLDGIHIYNLIYNIWYIYNI